MGSRARKAVVVGAGPVGCLAAISLARRGWQVELYEGRPGTFCGNAREESGIGSTGSLLQISVKRPPKARLSSDL